LEVLARVHADGDQADDYVLAEFAEIKEKLNWEREVKKPSYPALLFSPKHARRTWIGIGAQFWQQPSRTTHHSSSNKPASAAPKPRCSPTSLTASS